VDESNVIRKIKMNVPQLKEGNIFITSPFTALSVIYIDMNNYVDRELSISRSNKPL